MFRFKSSVNPVELKRRYLKKYKMKSLQRKLNALLAAYPEIKDELPDDCDAKKLLIGDFKYLTKVYFAFTGVLEGKSDDEGKVIRKAFVDGGFDYKNHSGNIGKFLTDPANGFEIYNCVYCDLEEVTSFVKGAGVKVRGFETEHVLDKGECPLVALSLYNFVPSCGTCNGAAVKGTKTIGDTLDEVVKLSPTVNGYDFEEKVRFVVNYLNPKADDLKALTHLGDYEIGFDVKDCIYQKSIDLFELKSRYNKDVPKSELIKWWRRKRIYTDNKLKEVAADLGMTLEETIEEQFELNLRRTKHYPMEKARRDVMMMY